MIYHLLDSARFKLGPTCSTVLLNGPHTVAGKVLESVHRGAVIIIHNIKRSHEEKLRQLGLTTLKENRKRGDIGKLIFTTNVSSGLHPPDIELVTPVIARARCSKDLEFTSKLNDVSTNKN